MTNKEKIQFIILIILLLIVVAILYKINNLTPEEVKTPVTDYGPINIPRGTPIPLPSTISIPTPTPTPLPTPTPNSVNTPTPITGDGKVQLAVPYINEAPDGDWTGPWKNACEEASITMIENYYNGIYNPSIQESKDFMWMLFTKQNEIWGSNADADAARTKILIDDYTSYNAEIITDPSIEDIKQQLDQGNPVISFHYGKLLNNPGIPFLATGSYYHVMVIIGYDDTLQQFITNDDGDIKTGVAHRYDYDLFMNSLHDFRFTTRKADGPPTVIFTSRK